MGLALAQFNEKRTEAGAALDFNSAKELVQWEKPTDFLRDFSDEEQRITLEKAEFVHLCWRIKRERRCNDTQAAQTVCALHAAAFPELGAKSWLKARNLRKWRGELGTKRGGEPDRDNFAALAPAYRDGWKKRREDHPTLDAEFLVLFMNLVRTQNKLTYAEAYRQAICKAREEGITDERHPSQGQVYDYLRKIPKRLLERARLPGGKFADRHGGFALLNWNCDIGEVLVGDHRILDLWVKLPDPNNPGQWIAQRPWMTAWLDVASNYMAHAIVYVDEYPNHRKIVEALYWAIRKMGNVPPAMLMTDNGKDYLKQGVLRDVTLQPFSEPSRGHNGRKTLVEEAFEDITLWEPDHTQHTHSVIRALGCQHFLADAYSGRQKPIERTFRDYQNGFDRLWNGYTGNKPENRPDYGREFKGNIEKLPSMQELTEALNAWLTQYHDRPNKGRRCQGKSPAEMWAMRTPQRAAMTDERLQWALLIPQKHTPKIRRNGSGADVVFNGWPYCGMNDEDVEAMLKHYGQEVMIKVGPTTPTIQYKQYTLYSVIGVFTLDGKYIATVKPNPEVDVFGKSEEKAAILGEVKRRIAIINKIEREELHQLTGSYKRLPPSTILGLTEGSIHNEPDEKQTTTVAERIGHGKGKAKLADSAPASCTRELTFPDTDRPDIRTALEEVVFAPEKGTDEPDDDSARMMAAMEW